MMKVEDKLKGHGDNREPNRWKQNCPHGFILKQMDVVGKSHKWNVLGTEHIEICEGEDKRSKNRAKFEEEKTKQPRGDQQQTDATTFGLIIVFNHAFSRPLISDFVFEELSDLLPAGFLPNMLWQE